MHLDQQYYGMWHHPKQQIIHEDELVVYSLSNEHLAQMPTEGLRRTQETKMNI
jgi:hypothetical protein